MLKVFKSMYNNGEAFSCITKNGGADFVSNDARGMLLYVFLCVFKYDILLKNAKKCIIYI